MQRQALGQPNTHLHGLSCGAEGSDQKQIPSSGYLHGCCNPMGNVLLSIPWVPHCASVREVCENLRPEGELRERKPSGLKSPGLGTRHWDPNSAHRKGWERWVVYLRKMRVCQWLLHLQGGTAASDQGATNIWPREASQGWPQERAGGVYCDWAAHLEVRGCTYPLREKGWVLPKRADVCSQLTWVINLVFKNKLQVKPSQATRPA